MSDYTDTMEQIKAATAEEDPAVAIKKLTVIRDRAWSVLKAADEEIERQVQRALARNDKE